MFSVMDVLNTVLAKGFMLFGSLQPSTPQLMLLNSMLTKKKKKKNVLQKYSITHSNVNHFSFYVIALTQNIY